LGLFWWRGPRVTRADEKNPKPGDKGKTEGKGTGSTGRGKRPLGPSTSRKTRKNPVAQV